MMSTLETTQTQTTIIRCSTTAPTGWNEYLQPFGYDGFHLRSEWAAVFRHALQHQPYFLWATSGNDIVGVLPLMFVSGSIFGKFLASQPYLNTGGVLADTDSVAEQLISRAAELADELDVKHLELRHERAQEHPKLTATVSEKVHMRVALPATAEEFWDGLKSKVRSQIRKPRTDPALTAEFGRHDALSNFYNIFCRNMRDLGTPPFAKALFGDMLDQFGDAAEICTVRFEGRPVASGFLLHGPGTTLIPSASALREYNHTSCNMLMYWHVIERSIERGQQQFDFGRSSVDAGTHKFKKQWGSKEHPAVWQYYSRKGDIGDARPNSGKYDAMIAAWQKLPVWLTRLIGPKIVQGIP
ncbi:MAG: FemAB family PEP-CTERM system-associated protein [Planctomycetaceae bacterium]